MENGKIKTNKALIPDPFSLLVRDMTCTKLLADLQGAAEPGSLQTAVPQNSRPLSRHPAFVSPGYTLRLVQAGSSLGPQDLSPALVPRVSCAPEAGQK